MRRALLIPHGSGNERPDYETAGIIVCLLRLAWNGRAMDGYYYIFWRDEAEECLMTFACNDRDTRKDAEVDVLG